MSVLNGSASGLVDDPGIPTLAKAFDPVVLRKYLPEVVPAEWGAIRSVRRQVLKHHPGLRCTFEITLGTTGGWDARGGKVHGVGGSDAEGCVERMGMAGVRTGEH